MDDHDNVVRLSSLYNCRVCGLFERTQPYGPDGKSPDYDFCNCCGVEHGYEDGTPEGARRYRTNWLGNGAPWFLLDQKPEDWDLHRQLKGIPEGYR